MSQDTIFSEFDPATCILDGVNLVEASAGTGKTYSIATLYQRLILEVGLPVESILVVTFTEAATAELKDRIRKRLKECLDFIKSGNDDPNHHLAETMRFMDEKSARLAAMKLEIALRTFDRASIFTIHGFCRKVLQEQAFETGSMFDFNLEPDLSELDAEIVSDFLRTRMNPEKNSARSKIFLKYLVENDIFSGSVAKLLSKTRPFLKIRIECIPSDIDPFEAENTFKECFENALKIWRLKKNEISSCLIESKNLNGNKYRENTRKRLLENIDEFLNQRIPIPVLFKDFEKLTMGFISKNTNKGKTSPHHEFFEICEELKNSADILSESFKSELGALKKEFLEYHQSESEKRKERKNILGFNDLLLKVHEAISGPMRKKICEALEKKFRAALIDEFQDTDHIQYDIFSTAFKGSTPLFLIGDPKQSIYGFRGADIFAYLKAASEADRKYTLTTNWRSDEGLIKAVNTLFSNRDKPFVFEGINYFNSSSAPSKKESGLTTDDGKGFLEIFTFSGKASDSVKKPENMICEYVTEEISKLVSGNSRIGGRALRPGDIAILVQKHNQGKKLKRYLDAAGIPSVSSGGDDVFKSVEANHMERLLIAVSDPSDTSRIKGALTTPFFGSDAHKITALNSDEKMLEETVLIFRDLHEIWSKRDFMQMFRAAITRHGVMAGIAGETGGERTITNLFHIAEILNHRESSENLSKDELLEWLSEKNASEAKGGEDELLRLESDSDAVRIITIHKSKGLEFPIVFCPFPAKNLASPKKADAVIIHSSDNAHEYSYFDRNHPDFDSVKNKYETEELAASSRLLYVALTRAKHRCYMAIDKDSPNSATGYLIFHDKETDANQGIESIKNTSPDESEKIEALRRLCENSDGAISLSETYKSEKNELNLLIPKDKGLLLRQFERRIRPGRILTSFSGIASGAHSFKTDPDIPETFSSMEQQISGQAQKSETLAKTIFDFPKGAEAGNFFHSFIENLDFSADDSSIFSLAEKKLAEFGFEVFWAEVIADFARRLISMELSQSGRSFSFSSINNKSRINEMGFYYPIRKLTSESLTGIFSDSFKNMEKLNFYPVSGFMRGFMDMIFEKDGLYYLVDWKSNHLGDEIEKYSPDRLKEAMDSEYYILQYHLYIIALDRYLASRIAGYSYSEHFGGVFYVFLRGISPEGKYGVFFDRPDEALIKRLSSGIFKQ